MKEYMKEYRKSQCYNVLKKIKETDELKSAKVDVVTKFIKDGIENFIDDVDADIDDNDNDDDDDYEQDMIIEFRSNMCDLLMEYLAVANAAFWATISPLLKFFFFLVQRIDKGFLKFLKLAMLLAI